MRKSLLGAAAMVALAVAGCAGGVGDPSPRLTFEHYQPVTLNAASVTVNEDPINAIDPDNVAGQFVVTPADAVKRYAAQRFNANGTSGGSFTVTIEDSRVHMRQIPQNNKVLQWGNIGTEDEYKLFLQLRVQPQPAGARTTPSTIKMERTLVMPSSVTLAEREMRQIKFLEKLIADVDMRMNEILNNFPAIRQ